MAHEFKSNVEKRLELCEEQIHNLQVCISELSKDFALIIQKHKQTELHQDLEMGAYSDPEELNFGG